MGALSAALPNSFRPDDTVVCRNHVIKPIFLQNSLDFLVSLRFRCRFALNFRVLEGRSNLSVGRRRETGEDQGFPSEPVSRRGIIRQEITDSFYFDRLHSFAFQNCSHSATRRPAEGRGVARKNDRLRTGHTKLLPQTVLPCREESSYYVR